MNNASTGSESPGTIDWGDGIIRLRIAVDADGRCRLLGILADRPVMATAETALPLVELLTIDRSRTTGFRYDSTLLGLDLRYVDHRTSSAGGLDRLEVELADPSSALVVQMRYWTRPGSGVLSASALLRNTSADTALPVLFLSSFALGDSTWDAESTRIFRADNDWLAESRWRSGTLAELGQPDVEMLAHDGAAPRGSMSVVGRGTWSTGEHLPMGCLEDAGGALLWQVEAGTGWMWQLMRQFTAAHPAGVLRLVTSGPNDIDHNAAVVLQADGEVESPVTTLAWSTEGMGGAIARLTDYRRAERSRYAGDAGAPVIYNDYMNTLRADPSTEKLLPLIAAASRAGAEIFIVDAGWYSEEPGWWDTVGSWEASTRRFPGGFELVFDAIRAAGMRPGLWLEPEVVGVRSPAASELPDDAFYQRFGARLVDNGRFQLDYRSPAVIARMDATLDRLISRYGLGYVKFDYNINPLSGTDLFGMAPGAGMDAAARAYLAWIDTLHERHPDLIIEDCSSGGMRADWLTVSHFALLSTSDQQDALHVPPIAAAAPLTVPPEQAGVWAYPQRDMPRAIAELNLAGTILARPIISGHVDELDDDQLELVASAIRVHKDLRGAIARSHPTWPWGLPAWDDPWVCSALVEPGFAYVTVWRRRAESEGGRRIELDQLLPGAEPADVSVEVLFPASTDSRARLVGEELELTLDAPGAVVLRLRDARFSPA